MSRTGLRLSADDNGRWLMPGAEDPPGANIGIDWRAADCRFSDWVLVPADMPGYGSLLRLFESVAPAADSMPCSQRHFAVGELLSGHEPHLVSEYPLRHFKLPAGPGCAPMPRRGRFYPAACFDADEEQPAPRQSTFCRVIDRDSRRILVDCNHPLAGHPLDILLCAGTPAEDDGGNPADGMAILARCAEGGPGMQARLPACGPDFWSDQPFSRLDEGDDSAAFEPSMEPFWERRALSRVSRWYRALLADGLDVLDLMAGVHSPLQESAIQTRHVSGAGLHRVELDANPLFDRRLALNVNDPGPLPWDGESFDAVLIHAAFEYVTDPPRLLSEIARILRPGGSLIITFSDHFVRAKATRIWSCLHPFERSGLVLELLRSDGRFGQFSAFSQRELALADSSGAARYELCANPIQLVQGRKRR